MVREAHSGGCTRRLFSLGRTTHRMLFTELRRYWGWYRHNRLPGTPLHTYNVEYTFLLLTNGSFLLAEH